MSRLSSTVISGEELPALRDVDDAERHDLGGREPVEPGRAELDAAGLGVEKAGQRLERRGLAGSVGADHGDDLALGDLKGDPPHGLDLAVGDFQILDAEHGY